MLQLGVLNNEQSKNVTAPELETEEGNWKQRIVQLKLKAWTMLVDEAMLIFGKTKQTSPNG